MARNTIEKIKMMAVKNNGELLTENYKNNRQLLKWRCNKGHIFELDYSSVSNGQWCKKCRLKERGEKQQTPLSELEKLLKKKNIIILDSSKYAGSKTYLNVECLNCNYKWDIKANYIKRGRGCPREEKHIEIKKVFANAEKNNWIILDDFNSLFDKNEARAKCNVCDFEWRTELRNLIRSKNCKKCLYIKQTNALEEVINFANSIDLKLLTNNYINGKQLLKWKCNNISHPEFEESFYVIKSRHRGCLLCGGRGKIQYKLLNIIKEIYSGFTIFNNYRKFDWLVFNGNKQEIDIFIKEFKIGLEYDGEQHYGPVCFCGISEEKAGENFKQQKERDENKNQKIAQNPKEIKHFIRFDYTEQNKLTKEYVLNKLIKNNIPIKK